MGKAFPKDLIVLHMGATCSELPSYITWCYLAPAEGYGPGPVSSLLDQRLVELAARPTVDARPALLAVVLNTPGGLGPISD